MRKIKIALSVPVLIFVLVVFSAFGCNGAGYTFPKGYVPASMVPEEFAATPNDLKYVIGSAFYATRNQWEQSPYYRIGDEIISLPVQILINTQFHACIVPGPVFALQPERVACPKPNRWRFPRPR